jgi:hypothetical protein
VLEHASAAASPVALAAHTAFTVRTRAAPTFRPHMTAVTAPTKAVAEAGMGAMTVATEAVTRIFDPLGSSHIALSSFT